METVERQTYRLESLNSDLYNELNRVAGAVETIFGDAQEVEFTIENGKLYLLDSVDARRTPEASVKIGVDMAKSGKINIRQCLLRLKPKQMNYFLKPMVASSGNANVLGCGTQVTQGLATGRAVFTGDDALDCFNDGVPVILICNEPSPNDISGINIAEGVLAMHGGISSVLVDLARQMGKCVVTGVLHCFINFDLL
jgi:pyruvate, orthophosphate dikinase